MVLGKAQVPAPGSHMQRLGWPSQVSQETKLTFARCLTWSRSEKNPVSCQFIACIGRVHFFPSIGFSVLMAECPLHGVGMSATSWHQAPGGGLEQASQTFGAPDRAADLLVRSKSLAPTPGRLLPHPEVSSKGILNIVHVQPSQDAKSSNTWL